MVTIVSPQTLSKCDLNVETFCSATQTRYDPLRSLAPVQWRHCLRFTQCDFILSAQWPWLRKQEVGWPDFFEASNVEDFERLCPDYQKFYKGFFEHFCKQHIEIYSHLSHARLSNYSRETESWTSCLSIYRQCAIWTGPTPPQKVDIPRRFCLLKSCVFCFSQLQIPLTAW